MQKVGSGLLSFEFKVAHYQKVLAFHRGGIVKLPQFLRAASVPVERDYDLFEQFPDGYPVWRGYASGLLEARRQLLDLSRNTKNECFAMHLPTKEVVARVNLGVSQGRKPVVFQITYDQAFAAERAEVLRRHGYEVQTVCGNESAKALLTGPRHCDLFIVGHAAPEEVRRDIVAWLNENYPGVHIIALNLPQTQQLAGANFNVQVDSLGTLLPTMAAALNAPPSAGSITR